VQHGDHCREVQGGSLMAGGCSTTLCDHAGPGTHCMVRSCPNFRYSCPVHGTPNK
jgi:hypothetical protein